MRKSDIREGAEAYYAKGRYWRMANPTRAVIVDPQPRRIVSQRAGAFYLVSHHPDPSGTAVLVDLHERGRVRRTAVPVRDLRGLWAFTLAATGRTVADVKAHDALICDIAARPGDITGADLLRVVASNPHTPHDVLTVLADTIDPQEQ